MDQETLIALKGSISKWQAIVDGVGVDDGLDDCPLCARFHAARNPSVIHNCQGCPVADAAGDIGCRNTPYVEFSEAADVGSAELMASYARVQLNFLISLLPKEAE